MKKVIFKNPILDLKLNFFQGLCLNFYTIASHKTHFSLLFKSGNPVSDGRKMGPLDGGENKTFRNVPSPFYFQGNTNEFHSLPPLGHYFSLKLKKIKINVTAIYSQRVYKQLITSAEEFGQGNFSPGSTIRCNQTLHSVPGCTWLRFSSFTRSAQSKKTMK